MYPQLLAIGRNHVPDPSRRTELSRPGELGNDATGLAHSNLAGVEHEDSLPNHSGQHEKVLARGLRAENGFCCFPGRRYRAEELNILSHSAMRSPRHSENKLADATPQGSTESTAPKPRNPLSAFAKRVRCRSAGEWQRLFGAMMVTPG